MGYSTPCKIVTPENIILKLCIHDYVGEMIHHANFGLIGTVGAFPQIGEILPLRDFFDCPYLFSRSYAQVDPLDRSLRFMAQTTCFRARMVLLGLKRWVAIFWGNMPPKLPKMGGNGQFQAKKPKNKKIAVSKTINRIKTKFDNQGDTNNYTSRVV